MNIYLYKKTHRKTGLKYLGMTTKSNPHKYSGSGTYWLNHLKVHGNDVDTEILHECSSLEELRDIGLHYSTLWNVVNEVNANGQKTWANLKDESGDGFTSDFNKKKWEDPEYKSKMVEIRRTQWDDSVRELRRELTKKQMSDPVLKAEWKKANRARWDDPEYRKNSVKKGSAHSRFDSTIYHFVHTDGKEEKCTRYELYTKYSLLSDKVCEIINGNRKSHKGWKVIGNKK